MFNRNIRRAALLTCVTALLFMTVSNIDRISAQAQGSNPLLQKWAGPYGGVPPWDKVKVADLKPALEAAMTEHLGEIDKIAAQKSAPTFENTIAPLERSGETL